MNYPTDWHPLTRVLKPSGNRWNSSPGVLTGPSASQTRVDHKQSQSRTNNGILEFTIPRLKQEVEKITRLKLEN